MTVKEVFDLRKQGKIEEAYEAIRPMYAVHQGKYTTLCMFWTASDVLKKRLGEKRIAEATGIFEALLRLLPRIGDADGKAHAAILHGVIRLSEAAPAFSMLDFVERFGVDHLTEEDWRVSVVPLPPDGGGGTRMLPCRALRLLTRCFHEVRQHPDADHALRVMPLLQEAARRQPYGKNVQRYMAVVYGIMGEREKAAGIYRQMIRRHHDSYLYAELAELTDDDGMKEALYCRAIQYQRQEKFCATYHLALARLLLGRDNARAAYELQKCIAVRKTLGFGVTREMFQMVNQLQGAEPPSEAEQQEFYRRMVLRYAL